MLPTRRDLHFRLGPTAARHWHARGAFLTHFINAMSLTFPEGERFFIHTVRHYRDAITDPVLKEAVTAFIGQEAMHGREHERYNDLLREQAGLPIREIEKRVVWMFDVLKNRLPPAAQLSCTIAQEHFTAIVAELLLGDPKLIEGADPQLAALWRWHALEEIEHKAVAFDVYEKAIGSGAGAYALRSAGMVATTLGFLAMVLYCQGLMLKADPRIGGREGFAAFLKFMFGGRRAFVPRLARPWLSYFRPGFHPWDHDNRHLLEQMDTLTAQVLAFPERAPRERIAA